MPSPLSVKERLQLLDLLPVQGDVTTLLVVREAQEALGFSADEHERVSFRIEDGRAYWNEEAASDKDVDLSDAARAIIIKTLRDLSDRQQLSIDQLPVYERFVNGSAS